MYILCGWKDRLTKAGSAIRYDMIGRCYVAFRLGSLSFLSSLVWSVARWITKNRHVQGDKGGEKGWNQLNQEIKTNLECSTCIQVIAIATGPRAHCHLVHFQRWWWWWRRFCSEYSMPAVSQCYFRVVYTARSSSCCRRRRRRAGGTLRLGVWHLRGGNLAAAAAAAVHLGGNERRNVRAGKRGSGFSRSNNYRAQIAEIREAKNTTSLSIRILDGLRNWQKKRAISGPVMAMEQG